MNIVFIYTVYECYLGNVGVYFGAHKMNEPNLNGHHAVALKKWEPPVMTVASIQSLTLSGSTCVTEAGNCPSAMVSKSGS